MIQSEGKGEAVSFECDVSEEYHCARVVEAAMVNFGRLDILINMVGVHGTQGTAPDVDIKAWKEDMDTNVTSMVMMAKYAIPQMMKNKPAHGGIRGSIVNMGSVAGLQGGTPSLLYPTSKGTVINLTRAMAAHHAKDGIRVNCVCPGLFFLIHSPTFLSPNRKTTRTAA